MSVFVSDPFHNVLRNFLPGATSFRDHLVVACVSLEFQQGRREKTTAGWDSRFSPQLPRDCDALSIFCLGHPFSTLWSSCLQPLWQNVKVKKIRNHPGVCIFTVKPVLFKGLNWTNQLRPFGSSPDCSHLQSDLRNLSQIANPGFTHV